jgi:hypothetical protein
MMGAMPQPVVVWKVELGHGSDLREVKGTLHLDDESLVFVTGPAATETRFPHADTRRARRIRGSPILVLHWERDGQERRTAFYFVPPPPIAGHPGADDATAASAGGLLRRPPSKRRKQRENVRYLGASAGELKATIQAWAVAIGERSGSG